MKRKPSIQLFLVTIAIAALIVAFRSKSVASIDKSTCKETLEECAQQPENEGKMLWENLSHQFFSTF
jgi:hypothetical protein